MADGQTPPVKPKGKQGQIFGLPQWAVIAGGTIVVVTAYLMWRKHQLAAQQAAAGTSATNPAPTYVADNGQASALFSQLQAMQGQLSNLTPQAQANGGQSWAGWEADTETLNDLARITGTTPQYLINQTIQSAGSGIDSTLQSYFDSGNYDQALPAGAVIAVPQPTSSPMWTDSSHTPTAIGGTPNGNPPVGSVNPYDAGQSSPSSLNTVSGG